MDKFLFGMALTGNSNLDCLFLDLNAEVSVLICDLVVGTALGADQDGCLGHTNRVTARESRRLVVKPEMMRPGRSTLCSAH